MIDAFHQLLTAWAKITPLCLLLEDLHWADAETMAVLTAVAPRLAQSGVLIIASYRGADLRQRESLWQQMQELGCDTKLHE